MTTGKIFSAFGMSVAYIYLFGTVLPHVIFSKNTNVPFAYKAITLFKVLTVTFSSSFHDCKQIRETTYSIHPTVLWPTQTLRRTFLTGFPVVKIEVSPRTSRATS